AGAACICARPSAIRTNGPPRGQLTARKPIRACIATSEALVQADHPDPTYRIGRGRIEATAAVGALGYVDERRRRVEEVAHIEAHGEAADEPRRALLAEPIGEVQVGRGVGANLLGRLREVIRVGADMVDEEVSREWAAIPTERRADAQSQGIEDVVALIEQGSGRRDGGAVLRKIRAVQIEEKASERVRRQPVADIQ